MQPSDDATALYIDLEKKERASQLSRFAGKALPRSLVPAAIRSSLSPSFLSSRLLHRIPDPVQDPFSQTLPSALT
jgi:hypothetical protein